MKAKIELLVAGLAVIGSLVPMSAAGASFKTPNPPTKSQVKTCVNAVTVKKALTKTQVNDCLATVMQTYVGQSCPKDPTNPLDSQTVGPKGYLITLGSWLSSGLNQTGINPRKAHHEYAIRVGSKPFIVANSNVTQERIEAAICPAPKKAAATSNSISNPVPFGQSAAIAGGWTVKVLKVAPDTAGDPDNPSPTPGYVYEIFSLQVTRTASSAAAPSTSIDVSLVGPSKAERGLASDPLCFSDQVPGDSPDNDPVLSGGTIAEGGCISMTTADSTDLVLALGSYDSENQTWFATK